MTIKWERVKTEWTKENTSKKYQAVVWEVEQLLREEPALSEHARARLIVSQLAHVHGMKPRGKWRIVCG